MGQCIGDIKKERLAGFCFLDELESSLCQQVMTVARLSFSVSPQVQAPVVVIEIFGEVVVSMVLIEIAEPGIEALIGCSPNRACVTQ
jgi:hypothetical protein